MTKDEALKLALEALGHFEKAGLATLKTIDAIIAVRECLEQQNKFNPDWDAMAVMVEEQQRMAKRIAELEAQQEPVAWQLVFDDGHTEITTRPVAEWKRLMWESAGKRWDTIPLYTTPPHRKPLTDKEIGEIAGETLDPWSCARAIEAAHGIKGEA